MRIPTQLTAGDSLTWTDDPFQTGAGQSISAANYALSYSLRGPSTGLDLAGTAAGAGWSFALSTTQSASLNTGATALSWTWHAIATRSGERITAGTGRLYVRPNLAALATSSTFDGRSQAEKDLAAVRAEMTARISGGATLEYTIGSRSLKREPMAALVQMEQRLLRIIQREQRAQAGANQAGYAGRIGVRFR